MDFYEHSKHFLELIDQKRIKIFLKKDKYFVVADCFHLSNVLLYFIRADFEETDYTVRNFFLALYLSHDIYEDSLKARNFIVKIYFNVKKTTNLHLKTFLEDKFKLFKKMNFNAYVDVKVSLSLFKMIKTTVWKRQRHSIAKQTTSHCKICKIHSYI